MAKLQVLHQKLQVLHQECEGMEKNMIPLYFSRQEVNQPVIFRDRSSNGYRSRPRGKEQPPSADRASGRRASLWAVHWLLQHLSDPCAAEAEIHPVQALHWLLMRHLRSPARRLPRILLPVAADRGDARAGTSRQDRHRLHLRD